MMEEAMALLALAVVVQGVIEGLKRALGVWDWVSLALGAVVCVMADVDVFSVLGVPLGLPHVGAALSGIVVGRGAAAVYDLWRRVKEPASEPPTA